MCRFEKMISVLLDWLSLRLFDLAQVDMCCSSCGIVEALLDGTMRYMSSAYLDILLCGEEAVRSEAVIRKPSGPIADP